ncbi:MAG: tRNA (N6-threonylcarbamoyladenosine(37)-N6)-methyltransferase TrmO [Bacteroidales bacterium]
MSIEFTAIGTIYTPFETKDKMPIQPAAAAGIKGHIILNKELEAGLTDLDGFSHIILIYHLHQSSGYSLLTTPFLDTKKRGVFATRAPKRPNTIGISVVRLLSVDQNRIDFENADMLNETPLLDIKPYIPDFDFIAEVKTGWYENKKNNISITRSDKRFD